MVKITEEEYLSLIKIREAVRLHRDQRGDDRCWIDDETLYKSLPEGYTVPEREVCIEIELCKKFMSNRNNPNITYVSPQRRIEELSEVLYKIINVCSSKSISTFSDESLLGMIRFIENLCQEAFKGYVTQKEEVPKEQFGHFPDEKE